MSLVPRLRIPIFQPQPMLDGGTTGRMRSIPESRALDFTGSVRSTVSQWAGGQAGFTPVVVD